MHQHQYDSLKAVADFNGYEFLGYLPVHPFAIEARAVGLRIAELGVELEYCFALGEPSTIQFLVSTGLMIGSTDRYCLSGTVTGPSSITILPDVENMTVEQISTILNHMAEHVRRARDAHVAQN